MKNIEQKYIDSREVAEMVGKEHKKLMRDIRVYIDQLGESKIGPTDFFIESEYVTSQNKKVPCYNITKKGCEFIAHKLTGVKGTEFTARYINRFHEMEEIIESKPTAALPDFTNPVIAARAWADEVEAKMIAQKQVEEQNAQIEALKEEYTDLQNFNSTLIYEQACNEPKRVLAEAIMGSSTSILIEDLAKIITQNGYEIGRNRLFAWMRDNQYLVSKKGSSYNMPTQKSVEQGLLEMKESPLVKSDGSTATVRTPLVTGKGQSHFINKFMKLKYLDDLKKNGCLITYLAETYPELWGYRS